MIAEISARSDPAGIRTVVPCALSKGERTGEGVRA